MDNDRSIPPRILCACSMPKLELFPCVFSFWSPEKFFFHDIYEQLRNYKAQLGSFQLSGCKIQHRYMFMTPTWESPRYPRLDFQGSELFADHGRRCVVVWQRTQEIPKKEGWLRGRCQVGVEMTARMTIAGQSSVWQRLGLRLCYRK